jgi:choline dehydrogenase-like flavoprotein
VNATADTVVIGSGITGLLVARELIAANQEVTVIERGAMRLDADQMPRRDREERAATRTTLKPTLTPSIRGSTVTPSAARRCSGPE